MNTVADEFPKGLSIRRSQDSLEVARSNAGDARLLAHSSDLEVIKGTLDQGHRLHVYPFTEPGQEATEVYYLLAGTLSFESERGVVLVEPGGHIVAQSLKSPAIFLAVTKVEFLYVSSKPSFAEISDSLKTLKSLARQIAEKDAGETDRHCRRIRDLAFAMGQTLRLSQRRLHMLDYAAYFHDVGKLMVPAEILQKPGSLTSSEWEVIRQHPAAGKDLLDPTFMREAGFIVEQHHERADGSGYPYGLQGDAISMEAYVIGVADSYDAITSDRPYRRARSHEEALAELSRGAGHHYPPQVIAALVTNSSIVAD